MSMPAKGREASVKMGLPIGHAYTGSAIAKHAINRDPRASPLYSSRKKLYSLAKTGFDWNSHLATLQEKSRAGVTGGLRSTESRNLSPAAWRSSSKKTTESIESWAGTSRFGTGPSLSNRMKGLSGFWLAPCHVCIHTQSCCDLL